MWLCYFVVGSDLSCLLKQLRPKAGRMVCEIPPFPIFYHSFLLIKEYIIACER